MPTTPSTARPRDYIGDRSKAMAIYNILHTSLRCPRCGVEVDANINCYFGYVHEMADLKIGDRYPVVGRRAA